MKKLTTLLILLLLFTACSKQEDVFSGDEINKEVFNKIDLVKNKNFIKESRKNNSIVEKDSKIKEYIGSEKKLKIKDSENKTILEAELLTDYNMMVGAGEDILIAKLLLIDWDKRDSIFDLVDFYDVNDKYKKIDREFTFKYAMETTTQDVCDFIDDKEICLPIEVLDWNKAISFNNLSELPNKNISIGIYIDTIMGEKIEWVPNIEGFDIYEWADYSVTQIDSLNHDILNGTHNSIVQIDSTHYILAYAGDGEDGYIKTFSIDSSSNNITQIDSLEHETIRGTYNSLAKIDSTHYILAYADSTSDGIIKTFSIDGSYDNITQIDSLEHDTLDGTYNSITQIDSTHYILAYAGNGSDGFIKTFSIDGSYNITQADSLEHDIAQGQHNSITKIDSTHYILAYTGNGADGYIKTFSIDGSYNITQVDSLEHDTTNGLYNSITQVDSTHYILAYSNTSGSSGYIKTFSIDSSSNNITQINSLEHDTVGGTYNSLAKIDSTHYILAYADSAIDGRIKTFSIDDNSDNITQIENLEHDATGGTYNSIIPIDSTHYILAYAGDIIDGYVKTFSVEIPPEDSCTYSGSGNWDITYSDNCSVTSETYVIGECNIIYDASGSFSLYEKLICNDLNAGAGVTINANNATAQIDIY